MPKPVVVAAGLAALLSAGCPRVGSGPSADTSGTAPAPTSQHPWHEVPAVAEATAPNLTAGPQHLWLTWLEPVQADIANETGTSHDGTDGDPRWRVRISRLGADGAFASPATVVEAGDLFVNWADFPGAAVTADGALYVHWLQKSGAAPYAYDAWVARSRDGRDWNVLGRLHDDGTKTEHGFVSWEPMPDEPGRLRATWLDGRATATDGPMTLRTATVGETVQGSERLDARVCECCGTDTAAAGGRTLVAYRDRTANEIRDIRVVRRAPDGSWSDVLRSGDNWKIPGCPVNGPRLATLGDDAAVVWFSAADGTGRVRLARSTDAGRTFGEPVLLAAGGGVMGRVDAVFEPDGALVVTWVDNTQDRSQLRVVRLGGDDDAPRPVEGVDGRFHPARGFPRLAHYEGRGYVTWKDADAQRLRVISFGPPDG